MEDTEEMRRANGESWKAQRERQAASQMGEPEIPGATEQMPVAQQIAQDKAQKRRAALMTAARNSGTIPFKPGATADNKQTPQKEGAPASAKPAQNKQNKLDLKGAKKAGVQMALNKFVRGKQSEDLLTQASRKGARVVEEAVSKALQLAGPEVAWVAWLLKGIFFGVKNIAQIFNRALGGDPKDYRLISIFFLGPYAIFTPIVIAFQIIPIIGYPIGCVVGFVFGICFGPFIGIMFHKQLGAILETWGDLRIKEKLKGAATGGAKK